MSPEWGIGSLNTVLRLIGGRGVYVSTYASRCEYLRCKAGCRACLNLGSRNAAIERRAQAESMPA